MTGFFLIFFHFSFLLLLSLYIYSRPDIDHKNHLSVNNSTNQSFNMNQNNSSTNSSFNSLLLKLNLNNIYTVEPLMIKLSEAEEPRAPTHEESEVIIKRLFETYRQQKQQV